MSCADYVAEHHTKPSVRWRPAFHVAGIAGCLLIGLSVSAAAQDAAPNEDPTGILVPDGLKRLTDAPAAAPPSTIEPPAPGAVAPAAPAQTPRSRLGEDVTTTYVGKVVRVTDSTVTILDKDEVREFAVPLGVRVLRDDKPARLGQLRPQDVVRVITDGDPDVAQSIVATSPAPTSRREPDQELRRERRADVEAENQRVVEPTGGRVWVLVLDPNGEVAQAGVRPGDMIVVTTQSMVQSESALKGLSSGLFPVRTNANGEVIITPNSAGVSILGPGNVAVPTGVIIGTGVTGTATGTTSTTSPNAEDAPVVNDNLGPPIGRRPAQGDRNFGPPIGTGNTPPTATQPPAVPAPPAGQPPGGATGTGTTPPSSSGVTPPASGTGAGTTGNMGN